MRLTAGAASAAGTRATLFADDVDVRASNILLVAIRSRSGGEGSGASPPSEQGDLLSTWFMAAPAVFSSVLIPAPAESTTTGLLEVSGCACSVRSDLRLAA